MDIGNITDKEIQFNIMMALMKIEGHLSDLVTSQEKCCYDTLEFDNVMEVNENDTSGINQ